MHQITERFYKMISEFKKNLEPHKNFNSILYITCSGFNLDANSNRGR